MKRYNWKISFFTIWSGQAISLITSAILQMAIIWYLTTKTGSAMILSIATIVGFLPQALLGSFIGVLVDRWNRKYVMIGADIIIALSGLALVLFAINRELPVWIIMIVLFIRSVGTAFHSPALGAATPLLVPEDKLLKCAGYSQSIQSVSLILSPAIAAFIYAQWGLNTAILLDILGALVACIAVAFVKIPNQNKTTQGNSHFLTEIKDGYNIVHSNRGLYALLLIGIVYTFFYMPTSSLFPLMSINYFNGTTTHASIVEIAFAGGMLFGGLLLGFWGGFKKRYRSLIASIALMGVATTLSGLLPSTGFLIFVICGLAMGLSVPFYSAIQTALFQEKINPEYLGRVFGLLGSIMALAMPLGLIVTGVFADIVGINIWFTILGICIIIIAIVSTFSKPLKDLE